MRWVGSVELDRWADTLGSRIALSELINDLVRASVSNIHSVRFPTGDSAEIPGYDGRLIATSSYHLVPDGESVWEFGAVKDYSAKANSDYDKRTKSPGVVSPKDTTYVAVTPRRWERKKATIDKWVNDRKKGPWKDVRLIDGVALEEWLLDRPAVASRFARKYEFKPQLGARCTDEFWDEYSTRFDPPLTEQVLLCGRDSQVEELARRLNEGGPQRFLLGADSPEEAVAFAVAAIRSFDENDRKFFESRTLVVDSEDAARELAIDSNLIFIPRAGALTISGRLARDNTTIVPLGRGGRERQDAMSLTRPTSRQLGEAIEKMGFNEDASFRLANRCGRSVTILEREIPSGAVPIPEWMDNATTIIPAFFAGGWDENAEADKAIITSLADVSSYADYEQVLLPFLGLEDPPIEREGSVWKMRAPVDAFSHLGPLIGQTYVDRLREVATLVFAEHDPTLDLPEEDRPFLLEKHQKLTHSDWLRSGLANTLALIRELHTQANFRVPNSNPQHYVDELIRELPGLDRDYRALASIRDVLPIVAEAAPIPLLSALEHLLEGDESTIGPIFRKGGFFAPASPHTGFLWALETLAWSPHYLARVALILARLAKIDPGGDTSNRPMRSLVEIFLPWHPGTNATLDQRIAVLDQLIATEPDIGWELLVELFPNRHRTSMNTAKPRYSEFGASEQEQLTWGLVRRGYSSVLERALRLIDGDPLRWVTIIESMSDFEPRLRERTYDLLAAFVAQATQDERQLVWHALLREVNRNRAYQDAEWAIKDPELARLDAMLEGLTPPDSLLRVAWLFDEHYPTLPDEETHGRREAVDVAREAAIGQVLDREGTLGIVNLADRVQFPQLVASAAGAILDDIESFVTLIDSAIGKSDRLDLFALALSGQAERKFNREWTSTILQKSESGNISPDQIVNLVVGWRDNLATWEFVESLGPEIDDIYWRRKQTWPLEGDNSQLEYAIRKYLAVGRAADALELIHRHVATLPVELIFEVLDAAVNELSSGKGRISNMFSYYAKAVFESLETRSDAPDVEVARREYAYLPIFGPGEKSLTLHRLMAGDPSFFVSILCDVFRASSGDRPKPTPEGKAKAEAGFRLLSSFELLPGYDGTEIDFDVLMSWINDVRALATEERRAQIADQYIGHVLAHAPRDPKDGSWPHATIREVIDRLASDEVESGIRVERHNMRGVYSKALYEGGIQERALAEEARTWAKSAVSYPRTAKMLNDIARSWDHEADREDERARQDQMRFE